MSKETVENITSVGNVTKEKLVETIKASKKEYDSFEQKPTVSTSVIMKDNFSETIEKLDSKIPTYVQLCSDMYKKYLHIISNFCNASYLAQKVFSDKTGANDASLAMFDTYLETVKKRCLLQIDINENMFRSYVDYRLMVLEFYDQMMNRNIANFTKMFSVFDNFKK